jgi:hypothetical protein
MTSAATVRIKGANTRSSPASFRKSTNRKCSSACSPIVLQSQFRATPRSSRCFLVLKNPDSHGLSILHLAPPQPTAQPRAIARRDHTVRGGMPVGRKRTDDRLVLVLASLFARPAPLRFSIIQLQYCKSLFLASWPNLHLRLLCNVRPWLMTMVWSGSAIRSHERGREEPLCKVVVISPYTFDLWVFFAI